MEKNDELTCTLFDFKPDAVIVDAGEFPTSHNALRWLDSCRNIVCCDGAANRYIASGRKPWRIVGDCDSLSPEIMRQYGEIVRHIPEQESNDQTKAVRFLAKHGFKRLVILGATGKREDHTLGNISLLVDYLKNGITARIYTDHGVFIAVRDGVKFAAPVGTQVSIFNFGAEGFNAEGLRYPLHDFGNWWEGTLNETTSPTFKIHAKGYFLLFIVYQHPSP